MTWHWGFPARMFATFMLFVATIRSRCLTSSRATASVLVPMFRKTEMLSGIAAAQASAMACFASAFRARRSS